MKKIISFSSLTCRHFRHGRCTNYFWKIMKSEGKPGLKPYTCIHWQNKLNRIEQYWEAVWRADCFGLKGPDRQRAIDRIINRRNLEQTICPNFQVEPNSPSGQCRYYYLQICLLKFPECKERCEDYIPRDEDQRA